MPGVYLLQTVLPLPPGQDLTIESMQEAHHILAADKLTATRYNAASCLCCNAVRAMNELLLSLACNALYEQYERNHKRSTLAYGSLCTQHCYRSSKTYAQYCPGLQGQMLACSGISGAVTTTLKSFCPS